MLRPSARTVPAARDPAGRETVTPLRREVRPRGPLVAACLRLLRDPMGLLGAGTLFLLVVVALLAPFLVPFDPIAQHPGQELLPPGAGYLLGTDEFGRDLLSRIIYGSRISLLVGVIAVALGAGVGVSTGLVAGYVGGWLDSVVMRVYDALLAFPTILLGIVVVTVLGPGSLNVAIAIAVAQMPDFARLTRSSVLAQREREYVQAARSIGADERRIMWRHVLPNCLAPLLVQLSLAMGFAVLAEAGLSFLGLGTQPPSPSWGRMLNDSRAYLRQDPLYGVWPGIALALLLVSLNYLSDALQSALDPRRIPVQ